MAKSQKEQGQAKSGSKGAKQNAMKFGSVGRNTQLAKAARERQRKQARLLEVRRDDEREAGTFHARVNEGRFTDLNDALRGVVGSYAYPGGNTPSVHFNVAREARKTDTVSVIRLEAAQSGHELHGQLFDPQVYVPCFYVMKHGLSFQSKYEDRLAAATQELIVHYFARASGLSAADKVEEGIVSAIQSVREAAEDDIFHAASTDYKAMLGEKEGFYLIPSPQGGVVVEVFKKSRGLLRVRASKNAAIVPSEAYLPVYLLFEHSLDRVTSEETYAKQIALFVFIRTELSEAIKSTKPVKRQRSFQQPVAPVLWEVSKEVVAPAPTAPIAAKPAAIRPPQPEDDEVDVTGHQPLTALQFVTKDATGIFHQGEEGSFAYFRRERIAGVPAFVLIAAEEGHPLVPCLVHHDMVHVHLQDLSANDRPYGNIADLKNARECVRQYLRRVGLSFGLRPKQTPTAAPQADKTA